MKAFYLRPGRGFHCVGIWKSSNLHDKASRLFVSFYDKEPF